MEAVTYTTCYPYEVLLSFNSEMCKQLVGFDIVSDLSHIDRNKFEIKYVSVVKNKTTNELLTISIDIEPKK